MTKISVQVNQNHCHNTPLLAESAITQATISRYISFTVVSQLDMYRYPVYARSSS